nr:hypothetical protein [Tanacetum cinerariifolium]
MFFATADAFIAAIDGVNNINEETQLHANVDGKKVVISEAFIRRDLQFGDEGGIKYLPNEVIFKQLTLMGTMASAIICLATNQKLNFSNYIFERTMKHLDNRNKFLMYPRKSKRQDTELPQTSVPTEFVANKAVNKDMNDSLRVKNLKKKHRSRTHKLKRLYKVGLTAKVISSSDDEALDKEDISKQGRIDKIDSDEDIALVSTHDDVNTQDNIFQDEGIKDVVSTAKTIVTTAPTITAESIKTIVEVTQAPKRKGVMIQEPEETKTIKIASLQQPQVQDKGKRKVKLIEEPEIPKKRKHQTRADKKLAEKLQAKTDEEDRLAREREREKERAQKEQEANDALINTWDDIQAKIDANSQLAQRLHEEKQL